MQNNYLFRVMTMVMIFLFFGNFKINAQLEAWELSNAPGNQISSPATTLGSNISTGTLNRGAGIAVAAASGCISSSGWFNTNAAITTINDAIANNEYYEFTLPINSGFIANITQVSLFVRASNTGPNTASLRSSADGFTTTLGTFPITATSVLNSIPVSLNSISGSLTFRIYGYGAAVSGTTGTGGTFRIGNSTVTTDNDLIITGTTTPISNNPTLSINDISITESNSGTTVANFTVLLSAPAPAGGVTFDIATANNTAIEPVDYTSISLTSQTIPAGSSTYLFSVNINGDTDFEPNEAFFVNVTNVIGATISDGQGQGTIINDDLAAAIKIHDIQGTGSTSPLVGSTQSITGIVTRAFLGTSALSGFYVQEEDFDTDADPNTSEGIFVFSPASTAGAVNVGDMVQVTGAVSEFTSTASGNTSSLTEITAASITLISTGNILPTVSNVFLPVTNLTDLEKYEGMLINLTAVTGNLVVTDNFNLGRYGQLVLAADDPTTNAPGTDARIDQYTQFNPPSVPGNTAYLAAIEKRLIYVDDANGSQNIDPILFGRGGNPLSAGNTLRTGDAVANVTAVLDHRFEGYRLQTNMSADLNVLPTNPRPAAPDLAGSPTLVVGNMNMLNFFNGDGLGGGFPTPRGANTLLEFTRQKDKTIQAIINSGADIMSLNEMENDGFGAQSAIQELVNGLNLVAGAGTWAFVSPPVGTVLSTDQITVGMIYKPAKALPVGDLKALTTGEFVEVGRGALAQTFKQTSDGAKFTLVGNHFKSKGSLNAGVGNPDIGDGQANNNGQRTRQAQQLAAWLATNPTGTTDPDYLIVGDLNAYAKEDPLTTLETAGYATLIPNTNTSYQFDGAHGALDHALGNASIATQKVDAKKWNINADEPTAIDYNIQLDNGTIIKTAGQITSLYNSDQYRNSDHDPVIVGLKLLCDKPIAILVSDPISGEACQGSTVTLTGSGGTLFSFNGATFSSTATLSVSTLGATTIKLKVKNAEGCESDEVEKVVNISSKPAEEVTTKTICSGETFTWSVNSQTYNSSTTVTFVNDGCTADQKLELTVAPIAYAMATNNQNKTLTAVTDFTTKECEHIARVEVSDISGDAAGFFNATVWVETDPLAGPFVQRHYQISPNGNDGQSGKAIVTLYFTQDEFNAYNAATSSVSTTDDLPTSPTDIDGISRLRIMKYPGTSDDGLGLPASYTGTVETINPIDTDIIFEEGVWKIKFPVSSFSGFFVNGQTVALPIRLIDFKGSKTAENQNTLIWNTVDQVNFEGFEIQKSSDSKTFESVGKVTATSFSKNKYQFIDHLAIEPINYYRLKMNDFDGKYEYSKVISVKNDKVLSIIGEFYPNPSQTFTNLKIVAAKSDRYTITAHDLMGRIIQTESLELQKGENLIKYQSNNLPKGFSFIRIEANGISAYRKLLKD